MGAAALDGLAFASFFGAVLRFFPLPAVGGGAFFPLLWVGPSPSPLGGGAFLTSNEWRCFHRLLVLSCASFTSPSYGVAHSLLQKKLHNLCQLNSQNLTQQHILHHVKEGGERERKQHHYSKRGRRGGEHQKEKRTKNGTTT